MLQQYISLDFCNLLLATILAPVLTVQLLVHIDGNDCKYVQRVNAKNKVRAILVFFGITGKNGIINHSEMVIPWANQSKLGLYLKMCAPKLYAYIRKYFCN